MLKIDPEKHYPDAVDFCRRFVQVNTRRRYAMERNAYAVNIAKIVDRDGFIDDFTSEREFLDQIIFFCRRSIIMQKEVS